MSVSAVVATIHLCIHQGGTLTMDWNKVKEEIDELEYDEIIAKVEDNVEILDTQNKVLGKTLAMLIWQIADNTGFTNYVLEEATSIIELTEKRLREDLKQCIEQVVEDHIEFQGSELQKNLYRVLEKQTKRLDNQDRSIDHLNEWRNRYNERGKDSP